MIEALSEKRRQLASRPVEEFTLDESLKGLCSVVTQSFGLVKLTMDEEIAAHEFASGNQAKLAYRMARYALVEVDGRRLKKEDGEDESALNRMDTAIRELILEAYGEISSAPKAATKKTLASRTTKA